MSGYVMVPSWLLDLDPSGTDLLVYCRLAGYGRFDTAEGVYEECRPPLPKLAAKCKVSVSTVQRSLRWLRERGAIDGTERAREDGSPLPTVYRVMFGNLAGPGVVAPVTPPPVTDATTPGVTDATTLVAPVTTEEEPSTQNPSTQSSEKPPASRARRKTKADQDADPRVGDLVARWVDYCGGKGVKLTPQAIGRYGKVIKGLLASNFEEELIRRALALQLERGKEAFPSMLDSFVIEVQRLRAGSAAPTSGAPAGAAKPRYPSAAERRDDARDRERAILLIIDELTEGVSGYNPRDGAQRKAVRARAEAIYASRVQVDNGSTACTPAPYTDGNRQTDIVDAEWTENTPHRKELTSHANG